ncbi:MAG: GTP-binding protein [Gemmatimonadota bacterium]|nr:MAG: GTP-binding protein [Gemmatimonadota bacterium]
MKRSGWFLLAGALALSPPVAAQEDAAVRVVPPHQESVPDYLRDMLMADVAAIRVPPPPIEVPKLAMLLHTEPSPDYLAWVGVPEPRPITLPAPPPGRPPAVVRGLYLNAWVFGSRRFYDLVALADTTEVNALVMDVKDATGFLSYRSAVPTAVAIGANDLVRVADPRARLALLEAKGIHAIARIVVARDPLLARGKPQWAVHDTNGGLWRDGLGKPWVDAFHDSVWIYAAEIAAEAVLMGFKEIQFDYVRFPDEPRERMERAMFPARMGQESKRAAVRRQVALLKEEVGRLGVPFTLDVFGLTTSAGGSMGIGQNWDDLSELADVLLPMVYPSHYPRGSYGIPYPNAEPYLVVRRALEDGVLRSQRLRDPARIRPYLQAFTLRRPRYTAAEVRAQIQAVEDVGLTDWVLWNASGRYPAAALRSDLRSSDAVLGPIASPNDPER